MKVCKPMAKGSVFLMARVVLHRISTGNIAVVGANLYFIRRYHIDLGALSSHQLKGASVYFKDDQLLEYE